MLAYRTIALGILFIPMALLITYWDVRYRRIPNELVLLTFIGGVTLNTIFGGSHGFRRRGDGRGLCDLQDDLLAPHPDDNDWGLSVFLWLPARPESAALRSSG